MKDLARLLFRGLALLAAGLAAIQPVLGAVSFFRPSESVNYETLHLVAGAGIYNVSIGLTLLAYFTGFRRRWILLALSAALYVLTHVQLLLGLESENDVTLLAWHIPLGVMILLLTFVIAGLSFGAQFDADRA